MSIVEPRGSAPGAPTRTAGHGAAAAAPHRPGHFFVAGETGTWHAVASASVHMGYRAGAAAPVAAGAALCGALPARRWGDVGGRPFGPLCRACAACLRLGEGPARAGATRHPAAAGTPRTGPPAAGSCPR